MFTKDDYQDYFQIIEDREKYMLVFFSEALKEVEDSEVAAAFEEIRDEERDHVRTVRDLFKCLGEYRAKEKEVMDPLEFGMAIVDTLIEHERLIGALYEVYAGLFEEDKDLWWGLAKEEEGHAKILERMKAQIREGESRFHVGVFSAAMMHRGIERVRHEMTLAKKKKKTRLTAMATACGLEQSLVEGKFYEIATSDSGTVRMIKDAMRKSIALHLERLRNTLAKMGGGCS